MNRGGSNQPNRGKFNSRYQPKSPQRQISHQPHQISIELPKKTVTTPFNIAMSPRQVSINPSQCQVTIERPSTYKNPTISKSVNDLSALQFHQADGQVAFQPRSKTPTVLAYPFCSYPKKDIYSPQDILAMKPVNPSQFEKLSSPGFVILMNIMKNAFYRKSPKRSRSRGNLAKKLKQAELIEHSEQRFVPTAMQKQAGIYNNYSNEAKRSQVQVCLNRMNATNMHKNAEIIQNTFLPIQDIVELLVTIASQPSDLPERNPQLGVLLRYSIKMASQPAFQIELVNQSLNKAKELNITANTPIESLQSIITWLSALFASGILTFEQITNYFDEILKIQPVQKAIPVLRTGLFTAGKALDMQNITESEKYFDFLVQNKASSGFIRFYVDELFELRKNKWVVALSTNSKTELKIEKNIKTQTSSNDIDDSQIIQVSFDSNNSDPPKQLTPATILRLVIKLLPKYIRSAYDFVIFSTQMIMKCKLEQSFIEKELEQDQSIFKDIVETESNPRLWGLLYMLYGGFYSEKLMTFQTIVRIWSLIPKSKPDSAFLIQKIGEITAIQRNDVSACRSMFPNPDDENLIDAFVESMDSVTLEAVENEIDAAVYIRDILDPIYQSLTINIPSILDPQCEVINELMQKYGSTIFRNITSTVNQSSFTDQEKTLILSYFRS